MRSTAAVAHALAHLATWWPRRRRREVARQYRAMHEQFPLVVADMMRAGLMFDDTFVAGDVGMRDYNAGRRSLALHVAAMIDLRPEEMAALKEETEDDGRDDD